MFIVVRRLQGLLPSNPGDAVGAPSGIWSQPVLGVPSNQAPEKSDRTRPTRCPLVPLIVQWGIAGVDVAAVSTTAQT